MLCLTTSTTNWLRFCTPRLLETDAPATMKNTMKSVCLFKIIIPILMLHFTWYVESLRSDRGEFKMPLQREVPPITPPLMPSRLSNPRTSLKSLRFGTPISSERKIEKDEEYVDENENEPIGVFPTTPHLKSFSEFSRDSVDMATSRPLRRPFTLVTSNFENDSRLTALPTFADLCPKSVNNCTASTNLLGRSY
ncbi:unnamed protein product [Rodentolepis nana]|uniref:Uncharacterized protein n=1 Tax=Rodentolepis nana TaxID=102285 RepID=A0A0R3TIS6_RODNA|nr:unnamed protein product [Rodentolepis nana]